MKRVSFLAALLLLFSALTVRAEIVRSGFCGEDPNPGDGTVEYGENLSWTLTDDGVLTISGSGRMFDASYTSNYNYNTPWYAQRNLIKTAVIGQGVTSIGIRAFYDCTSINGVILLGSITSIGAQAFHGCSGLTEVTIGESVAEIGNEAFYGCRNLKTLNYNATDCNIEVNAFTRDGNSVGWTAIETLNIGDKVRFIHDSVFYFCSSLTDVTIPEGVTSIGALAFSSCSGLTELTIPENVAKIGYGAFSRCDNLKTLNYNAVDCKIVPGSSYGQTDIWAGWTAIATLNIGGNVKTIPEAAFSNCTALTEVTIPDGVGSIGSSAFNGCNGLTEVTIGESVAEIGYRAFSGCDNLKTLNYNAADCKTVPGSGYNKDDNSAGWTAIATLNIGDRVKSIPDSAFYGCTGLTELTIPEGVAEIGFMAFYGCDNIKTLNYNAADCKLTISGSYYRHYPDWQSIATLNIGGTVKVIPDYAFRSCTGITEVIIPHSVTQMGSNAFAGCRALASVSIPESVTAIPDSAFYGCTSLDGVILPGSTISIGAQAFSGCSALSEIVIPEGVIQMGIGAFYGCRALASVSIPQSVTVITAGTFQACSSLDGVIIPQSVTSIGSSAFNGCSSLSEIVIPEGVTEIGENAFFGCSALPSISVPESVTKIGSGAFRGCSSLVSVLIPEGVTIDGSPFGVQYPAGYPYDDEYKQYPLLESLIIRSDIDYGEPILNFSASPLLRYLEVPANVFNDGRDNLGFNQLPVDSAIVSLGTLDYKGFEFLTQCRNTLRHIDLSAAENTELPSEALSNCLTAETFLLPTNLERVGHSAFSGCKSLRSIVIPASVTDIDDSAFEDCRQLTDITFGNDPNDRNANTALSRIGNWAFYNCHLLEHLSIPEGVTEIGNDAFHGCESLKDLELPSTIQTIGNKGFASGSSVQRISVRATDIPSIEEETFADVSRSIPVYVPDEYVDAYRNAPYWKELNIVGVNTETSTDGVNISALYRMEDGRIVLTEEMPVSVYTASGALIYSGTATEVPLPAPGVYLLRIGGETVKVVRP